MPPKINIINGKKSSTLPVETEEKIHIKIMNEEKEKKEKEKKEKEKKREKEKKEKEKKEKKRRREEEKKKKRREKRREEEKEEEIKNNRKESIKIYDRKDVEELKKIPEKFHKYLSKKLISEFDPDCGKPILYGFEIITYLGDKLFEELRDCIGVSPWTRSTGKNLTSSCATFGCGMRMTVVFVTHSTAEATFLANRAVVLSSRPARTVADLPVDLPERRVASVAIVAAVRGGDAANLRRPGARGSMKARRTIFSALWPPAIVLAAAILAMHVAANLLNEPFLLPRPSAVAKVMFDRRDELVASLWTTAEAALIGFCASGCGGIAVGMILSASPLVRRAIYPYTVFFQTVPIVAIAPLLMIWCGPGLGAVALSAFIVSVFPVIANTLGGLLSTDPALEDLFRLYGASRWARLWKLKLPTAPAEHIHGAADCGGPGGDWNGRGGISGRAVRSGRGFGGSDRIGQETGPNRRGLRGGTDRVVAGIGDVCGDQSGG